jgi:hypothetical protein
LKVRFDSFLSIAFVAVRLLEMARILSLAALALMLRACAAQGGNPTRFYSTNNIPPIGPEVITSGSTPAFKCNGIVPSTACASCTDLQTNGIVNSGVYWLQPAGSSSAFQGYCDMKSYGGGWLQCYTDSSHVYPRTETTYSPDRPFGTDGYRSNCMTLPFNQIMYTDHNTGVAVLFSYERQPHGSHSIVLSGTRANGWLSDKLPSTRPYHWQGFGIAKDAWGSGRFQLLACLDSGAGLVMSGVTSDDCAKTCGNSCNDRLSPWFRHPFSCSGTSSARSSSSSIMGYSDYSNYICAGTAFNVNGLSDATPSKRISVALRFKTKNPYTPPPPPFIAVISNLSYSGCDPI